MAEERPDTEYKDEVICPHCGAEQSEEIRYEHISIHGTEDGPQEQDCESCDKPFWVQEYVSRNYTTLKTVDEDYNGVW